MIVEEMFDWWSKNWGWYYPLQHTLENIKGDWIFKKSLLEIKKRCMKDYGMGFIDFFNSYPGTPKELKDKYLRHKFGE
jgi:hypothetical protein